MIVLETSEGDGLFFNSLRWVGSEITETEHLRGSKEDLSNGFAFGGLTFALLMGLEKEIEDGRCVVRDRLCGTIDEGSFRIKWVGFAGDGEVVG